MLILITHTYIKYAKEQPNLIVIPNLTGMLSQNMHVHIILMRCRPNIALPTDVATLHVYYLDMLQSLSLYSVVSCLCGY